MKLLEELQIVHRDLALRNIMINKLKQVYKIELFE